VSDKKSLRDLLTEAGNKFDGHVTNGSLDAQMKVLEHHLFTMSAAGYLIDVWGTCAECGGGVKK
jgi:hypothetical protein